VVAGNQLFRLQSDFTGVVIGTLATSTGPVSMTDNGQAVFIADGANRYAYTWATGVFARSRRRVHRADIVDVDRQLRRLQRARHERVGLHGHRLDHLQRLNFGRKDSAPDNIVSLIVNNREVFLLGEKTSEVWVDAGLFPFPFQKLPGTNMQHGCAAKHSMARLGESFAWLARTTAARPPWCR
jgi:hypothetical protein